MKRSKVDRSNKRKAFAREQRNQPTDAEAATYQFAMRLIWVALGTVCAVLGTVLLAILWR
jgi:hypothetical protein